MSESARTERSTVQSPTSISIEALEEIVRNCQRNEEHLHELERHTRHERKKAERLLLETSRTMQERNSRNTSSLENHTTNDNSHHTNEQKSNEFFVPLDDDNENENHDNYRLNHSNKKPQTQDKHLLERIEKLLAGDGTTTSSEVMSSQERKKKVIEKTTSPVEDDIDDKSLDIENKNLPESRQLPSACSIEYELSTVDRFLSERTPTNAHRIKSDSDLNQTNKINGDKKILSDKRDQQFYERLNNYVQTGRFVSPDPEKQTTTTTTDDEIQQYQPHSTAKTTNKDDELADLAHRCEDLLSRLHTQRNRAVLLENSSHHHHQQDYYRRQTPASPPSHELKHQHHRSPSSSHESKHRHHRSPSSSHESKHRHHRSPSPSHESKYQQHQSSPPSSPPAAPPPMSLQQALELLRPEFISRSRQRARRIRLLREEREHNTEIDRERRQMLLFSCTTCCTNPPQGAVSVPSRRNISYIVPFDHSNSSRAPLSYREMKRDAKKKYEQLPEAHNRRRQNQMDENRRRNYLRAKVFRTRLRQHVIRHGRTNIDESLTMIDT